jgi:hypothetical protein
MPSSHQAAQAINQPRLPPVSASKVGTANRTATITPVVMRPVPE